MDNKKSKEGTLASLISFFKENRRATIIVIVIAALLVLLLLLSGTDSQPTVEGDDLEARLEELCSSINGVGRCRVMVSYTKTESRYGATASPTVESVAIVCQGADKPQVRQELTLLFTSLFGIGANRVHISRLKR